MAQTIITKHQYEKTICHTPHFTMQDAVICAQKIIQNKKVDCVEIWAIVWDNAARCPVYDLWGQRNKRLLGYITQ